MKKIAAWGIKNEAFSTAELIAAKSANLILKESIQISSSRAVASKIEITFNENDLLQFIFEDGTTWMGGSEMLYELFPDAAKNKRSIQSDVFEIPSGLGGGESNRGLLGDIGLKLLHVFTKQAVKYEIKKIAARLEKKLLENMSGLYHLDKDFKFTKTGALPSNSTYLLFLHGTGSSTSCSFEELKNSELWKFITDTYKQNIICLQHETLTKSPLENVIDIFKELPKSCTLHLITHSRGGLVGEVLTRFCNGNKGFSPQELDYLGKPEFNRKADIANIVTLTALASNKNIKIEKYLRVACPASGTTLLSKRLDHFLNISFNLLSLIGPVAALVAGEFKELLAAVTGSKNNPEELSGLEAMNPDSPFIKALNNPSSDIIGDLTIISGNCGIKFNLKALLIIAGKLFYQKENDLIVDTKSMYYGNKRNVGNAIQYFYDEGPEVDHFHYFQNKKTQGALLFALNTPVGKPIPNFTKLVQPDSAALDRNAVLSLDGGKVSSDKVSGNKPIIIILPGIMGSNLEDNGNTLWINYLRFLAGDLTKISIDIKSIKATSLIRTSYGKLVEYFKDSADVVTFAFDWRRPLPEAAEQLKTSIEKYLAFKQPIQIIAHSMGGVVARDFIINHPLTWAKLNKSKDFKLLMLGAPLGGSFRIPYVLAGKDPIINKLSKIDIVHSKKQLLDMFRRFPGLLNLLPLVKTPYDFANENTWQSMKQASEFDWNIPDKADLQAFANYRDKVLELAESIDMDNIFYIAGKDDATICDFEIDNDQPGEKLIFKSTVEGDQSVTWETGIPKALIGTDRLYYADVSHGSLANDEDVFKGIDNILKTGKTTLLSAKRPAVRGSSTVINAIEEETWDISERSLENSLLALKVKPATHKKGSLALKASVSNGDLYYSLYPVITGHFINDGITSAEKVIDSYCKNLMSQRHSFNMYPGKIGTNDLFLNCQGEFKGAIVVGIGEPGKLSAFQLTQTIEQGITKYLLELRISNGINNNINTGEETGISVLLIGCGYGGLPVESSVRAIIQGIQNANSKLLSLNLENSKIIEAVEFVELYEDRCLQCLYALGNLEKDENNNLNITVPAKKIKNLPGRSRRIPKNIEMEWWKRISITRYVENNKEDGLEDEFIRFSCSTGSAREEQQDIQTSPEIIDNMIEELSTSNKWDEGTAKTVFELLIPNAFKDDIKKQSNTMWIVDNTTAAYPWELLQDSASNAYPLCYNAGMIRQLAIQDYNIRPNMSAVVSNKALVIGDPDLNGYPYAPQLPGALKEAKAVETILATEGFEMPNNCLHKSSAQIIKALFREDYKIIHLSGHGIFNSDRKKHTGMLIGNDVFLTTKEISQMSILPELVFINCCFLGKIDPAAETARNRNRLAANIGTQLIKDGVKAVVAAGWAVGDDDAEEFAKTFYKAMFTGKNFGEAVKEARQKIFSPSNNTWGAYQCYGDPYFVLNRKGTASPAINYMIPEEAEIDLFNLINRSDSKTGNTLKLKDDLAEIVDAINTAGISNAGTTEKEAMAFAELNDYENALLKFEKLLTIESADFSIKALEKYSNIRAKKCVQDWQKGIDKSKQAAKIEKIIKEINLLLYIGSTSERLSILGSAYKRKSMLTGNTDKKSIDRKVEALGMAADCYYKAHYIEGNKNKAYTLINWLEIENILVKLKKRKWGSNIGRDHKLPSLHNALNEVFAIACSFENKGADLNYWDKISKANAFFCMMLLQNGESKTITEEMIVDAYTRIWNSTGSKNKKVSEKEHFDFLIDAYSLIKQIRGSGAKAIIDIIDKIKQALEAVIQ
jgi:CHAT domain-containing protein